MRFEQKPYFYNPSMRRGFAPNVKFCFYRLGIAKYPNILLAKLQTLTLTSMMMMVKEVGEDHVSPGNKKFTIHVS